MGIRIEKPDDVGDAWDRALSADRPVLFEARTDPAISLLPPHITFEQAKAFATALRKGDPEEVPVIVEQAKQLAAQLFPKRGERS
ncbi:MAG: thiamine pyrophosphate-requiring protein, partial [Polyangiaceae bacterium]